MSTSRVVLVREPTVLKGESGVDPSVIQEMVARGISRLTGEDRPADGWRHFFSPKDSIGIKLNCLGGRILSSNPVLARAVAEGLKSAGIPERNLIFWDRTERELKDAGYSLNAKGPGPLCYGTDSDGLGYESELSLQGSIASLLSRIVTTRITALLNLPILKDHNLAGLSGGMKNLYGCIHNPNKYHDNNCDPYVADVCSLPQIRSKNKLTVVDALRIQFNGGPAYKPQWLEPYGGIILGDDPVAVDRIALKVLEEIRQKRGLPDLAKAQRFPKYLKTAADKDHALGKFELGEIEIVTETIS